MALTVIAETYPEYLKVVIAGDWSVDGILHAIEGLKEKADRAGRSRILADLRDISGDSPTFDERYDAGRHVAMFLPEYRLAVVTYARQIMHVADLAANNRGAVMAVFASEEEAVDWLIR